MKIESITIQNFKLFECLQVSFKNKTLEETSNRFLILGDNGSGKTTLLQAIALPLALATRQISDITHFEWIGFLSERYARWGSPHIELEISFTAEEIAATREIAARWNKTNSGELRFIPPDSSKVVRLTLDGTRCAADTRAEYSQFAGRYFAQKLLKTDYSVRPMFSLLPGLFWFDQYRNAGSNRQKLEENDSDRFGGATYEMGVERLRRYLTGWKLSQQSRTNQFDYLAELERLYKRVFPNRSFAGVEPRPGVDSPTAEDFFFLLNDGNHDYDIMEMSAGEQAIFPILYEFVRQQIANSIVLIDEIDLNLHPPLAQLLVNQLPKIGPTCQFLFTTHSEAVNSVISQEETFWLPRKDPMLALGGGA